MGNFFMDYLICFHEYIVNLFMDYLSPWATFSQLTHAIVTHAPK